ncbi:MAG TPA: 2-oxo acid dehydrogenase subunit E2 [Pirellulales bacterium]|jgi:pyruvate/2-oxoglutarate dehydrogenase complex dihydrolipoamide acyltransferase (E2) component|nr:2-oxo acid dehydrogenase subunit E2 [Pirellulales bacterium]
MATDFKLPELGENIESGDIVSVMVKEGDTIRANQGVVEIETDKAVVEVPCSIAGKVSKIHVKPGQTVKVGEPLLSLDAASAAASPGAKPAAPAAKAPAPAAKPAAPAAKAPAPAAKAAAPAAKAPAPQTPASPKSAPAKPAAPQTTAAVAEVEQAAPSTGNGHAAAPHDHLAHPAGPAVRRLARELGVDLGRVTGTGEGGRIVKEDVVAAVRQATAAAPPAGGANGRSNDPNGDGWGKVRREPMPKIRKTIAVNLAKSAATIPHVTNFDDADVTELEKMRKLTAAQYAESGIKLTMLAFVMKAISHSLKAHPTINATIDMDSGEIIYKEYVSIGVAVDAPRGLIVPVMRHVDQLSIPQIAQSISTLAEKAKASQFGIDDLRGGSFTISNMGSVGGVYSTPIINPPEVAILLVGRARKLPVVLEDQDDRIVPRLMLPLSLSYDHRLVDGATAARFLNEVIGYLEQPGRLLLAP